MHKSISALSGMPVGGSHPTPRSSPHKNSYVKRPTPESEQRKPSIGIVCPAAADGSKAIASEAWCLRCFACSELGGAVVVSKRLVVELGLKLRAVEPQSGCPYVGI
jgi:hypothetical protein